MTQWIEQSTRFRGNEEAPGLHLPLTKELDVIRDVNYQCPLGRNDHVLNEFEVNKEGRREEHRNGRYNYGEI